MRIRKGIIAVLLCVSMLLTSIVPSFSLGEDTTGTNASDAIVLIEAENTFGETAATLSEIENEDEAGENEKPNEEAEPEEDTTTVEASSEENEETSETIESTTETAEETESTETTETSESVETTTTAEETTTTVATIVEGEKQDIATESEVIENIVASESDATQTIDENNACATVSEITIISVATNSIIDAQIVLSAPTATVSTATESTVKRNKYSLGASLSGYKPPIAEMRYGNGEIFKANLPESFDARNESTGGVPWVPAIKNQGAYGTCWAFATLGAAETSLRKNGLLAADQNLSVPVLAYFAYDLKGVTDKNSQDMDVPGLEGHDYSFINRDYFLHLNPPRPDKATWSQCGGDFTNAARMMSSFMGLVIEDDDTGYYNMSYITQNGLANELAFNSNDFVLTDALFINKNNIELVKDAIMKHGSVGISYCVEDGDDYDKACHQINNEWYYCSNHNPQDANHSIMVVGWDDTVPKENFYFDTPASCTIPSNGAWLCRNSWGAYTESNGGYFWLSYYDRSLDESICAIDAVKANEYKYNYHYDTTLDGGYITYNNFANNGYKIANIFKVSDDEDQLLDAVSLGLDSTNATYDIMIYTNKNEMKDPTDGELQTTERVSTVSAGIYTTDLKECVALEMGTYFSIVVKPISTSNTDFVVFIDEEDTRNTYFNSKNEAKLNQSFIGYKSGGKDYWDDINTNDDGQSTLIPGPNGEYYGLNYRIKGLSNAALRVTFNSGDGNSYNQLIRTGATAKLFKNEFTKSGYRFLGWEDTSGNSYDDEAEVTLTENLTLTALWEYTGGGGSSDSGSGGGSSGKGPIPQTPQSNAGSTTVNTVKTISSVVSSDISTWTYDPTTNKWKLNVRNSDGQSTPLSNGFYLVTKTISVIQNGMQAPSAVNDTYYFDASGNMVTGWVKTSDNRWYFFENAKTADEGKMVTGWKSIAGSWYYFVADGSMMTNGRTPDGYLVGSDGRYTV